MRGNAIDISPSVLDSSKGMLVSRYKKDRNEREKQMKATRREKAGMKRV